MKIKSLVISVFVLCLSCSSELEVASTDIPQAVTAAFQAKYAGAEDVSWEAEKEGDQLVYEVEFKHDGERKEAKFDANGSVLDVDQ